MSTTIINGDCLTELPKLSENSIDLLVTDPPYGYQFMGKDWDKSVVSVDIWKACIRVLKPGAFAFIMSSPRQDVLAQMIVRLQEAGFETNFTSLYWAYASGFPKAANVGKLVDKRNGRASDNFKELGNYLRQNRLDKHISMKDIAKLFPSRTGGLTGCVWNWENGENVPTQAQYDILKQKLGLDNRFDELIEREEAEREVIESRRRTPASQSNTSHEYGFGEKTDGWFNVTKAATPAAQRLDGSYAGYQPKPAVEVVLVCMKPLEEKTYVDQALSNNKGVTWLDDGRIPHNEPPTSLRNRNERHSNSVWCGGSGFKNENHITGDADVRGRFPANLLVEDDILNDGQSRKVGKLTKPYAKKRVNCYGQYKDPDYVTPSYGDSGSFSRYFSLDAWASKTLPFLIVAKASKAEKNKGLEDTKKEYGYRQNGFSSKISGSKLPTANNHPTVKPLKLMSYLVTMGSRPNDIVLDPFTGSGTTGIAALQLGRRFLGIELSKEYAEIAEKRLKPYLEQSRVSSFLEV